MVVFDLGHCIEAGITDSARYWASGHTLVTARMERGQGWQVSDCPDGRTPNTITLPSKAKARAEVNRRARAHAKRLGLPFEHVPVR